ncbi:MAG: hypothetical protein Q9227_004571 [Pyrenula ochraceoflavens]
MSLTFIAATPTGAATRTVSAKDRRQIRSQVMRTSWNAKKAKKQVTVRFVDGTKDVKEKSCSRGFRREQTPGFALTSKECVYYFDPVSPYEKAVGCYLTPPDSDSEADIPMQTVEDNEVNATQCTQLLGTQLHSDILDYAGFDSYPVDEPDSEGQPDADPRLPSPSSWGIDPYSYAAVPLNFVTARYLNYYLIDLLPHLHPFPVQQNLFQRSFLPHLSSSPLILSSVLALASLRLDNYSNRLSDLFSFYRAGRLSETTTDIPHSFRFKSHTVQLLRKALAGPTWQNPPYDVLVALINLASYSSLVSCPAEAQMHIRGLHALMRQYSYSHAKQSLSDPDSKAIDALLGTTCKNKLWPEALEPERVKCMVSWQATLPPIIGVGFAGHGESFIDGELEFVDAARAVGVGYCFLGPGDGSELLHKLIGEIGKTEVRNKIQKNPGSWTRATGPGICLTPKPNGFKPTCRRIGCDGRRSGSLVRLSNTVMSQAIEALMLLVFTDD